MSYLAYSSINRYRPSKVLAVTVSSSVGIESWLYDDGFNDPWWRGATGTGSSAGKPTKFRVVFSVTASGHSSHLTRKPFSYDGLDIKVGDWICGVADPKALKIVKIESKTTSSITAIIEDVDRYNTFRDPNGNADAMFSTPGTAIVFGLGDDGLPVLDPIVSAMSNMQVFDQVMARFRVFNPNRRQRFEQVGHGFTEGNMLKVNPATGLFERATSSDLYPAGVVSDIGPGPNVFYLTPTTKIIMNLEPGLPGNAGEIIYQDAVTPGLLTSNQGSSSKAVFVKLTDAKKCYVIGDATAPTTSVGNKIEINKVGVVFSTGTGGTASASDILTDINATTTDHGVTAVMSSPPTTITGTAAPAFSDVSTGAMAWQINSVSFSIPTGTPSITYAGTTYPGVWDFLREINERSNETGVYASESSGSLVLTHASGGNITVANVTPATTNGNYKSFTDAIGVTSVTAASPSYIKLEREDGGEIIIANSVGVPLTDMGVNSVANGELPMGLVIEQGGSNLVGTYVVADVTSRNNLQNLTDGSTAFVQDDGNGEWAMYVYSTGVWVRMADEDSADTDANTLSASVLPFSSANTSLGNVSASSRVTLITVEVVSVFNGSPTLSIGDAGDSDRLMADNDLDLSSTGTYTVPSSYQFTNETELIVYFVSGGATSGSAKIIVSYM